MQGNYSMNDACSDKPLEVGAIAELLANCHDWFVPDLPLEVGQTLRSLFPGLSPGTRSKILESFFALPIEERMSPYFDHLDFVQGFLKSEEGPRSN